MSSKVDYLVIDTSAFIKNIQLQNIGENIISIEEVVNEIKEKRQLRRLVVLPYDLQIQNEEAEDVKFVTEFSKKTGDFPCLSATDIKVIALTYKLERELLGTDHLRKEPVAPKVIQPVTSGVINETKIAGFYLPDNNAQNKDEGILSDSEGEQSDEFSSVKGDDDLVEDKDEDNESSEGEYYMSEQDLPEVDDQLLSSMKQISCSEQTEETECDQNDPCALDDDDAGWITPSNLKEKKKTFDDTVEVKHVKVACLTTDYAMQNVLKQIGLNVVSIDGLLIRQLRTFIFRCYACFKTTSNMTKVFCPWCGNKTLKRVGVTVDDEGKEHIHINFKRQITARGKRFPIPKFKGGKHANNPILSEGQRVPQQLPSKLSQSKTNAFDPDYIAGASPFSTRDVYSKAAALGICGHREIKYWMRKNPNQVVKKRRK